jgi:hypothetical protein
MQVHQCSTGQRVLHKESGKLATIRRIYGNSGELELAFENGTTAKVHARLVGPAESMDEESAEGTPARPCPQCAAKMPSAARECPSCGFQYGVRKPRSSRGWVKYLLVAIILILAAYGARHFRR